MLECRKGTVGICIEQFLRECLEEFGDDPCEMKMFDAIDRLLMKYYEKFCSETRYKNELQRRFSHDDHERAEY